jgi:glycosyltransferase involved in cell wall biosynthesis
MFDASVAGIPHFIYTDHTALANTYYPSFEPTTFSQQWLSREREIYDHAELIFTMSSHVSRSLVEHYGIDPDRVRCVLAGGNVDVTAEEPAPGDHSDMRILFAGRDWKRKGGPQLLAAFSIVREKHPNATLVVAGCSPKIDCKGVTMLGDISVPNLSKQYRRSAVFCMPTREEPFGLVFLEAFAHGVPVVATNIGALPDIVQDGETGFLREPNDIAGLADALDLLLSDPKKARQFGALGRQRVLARYTWPRVIDSINAQIRNAVGARL